MEHDVVRGAGLWFGGVTLYMLGGYDLFLEALLVLMVTDYILGVTIAGVFKKSPKSCNGGLNSNVGFMGILKKVTALFFVVVAVELQKVTGIPGVREGVILAITVNELISIIEHAGVMEIPIPKQLIDMIDILKPKGGKDA